MPAVELAVLALVCAEEQDRFTARIEQEQDPKSGWPGARPEFFHVRVLRSGDLTDDGPLKRWALVGEKINAFLDC